MKRRYYSTSEVAKLCNVHRNTIIAAIRNGRLPAYKTPGGHARVSHPDLVQFASEKGLPVTHSLGRNDKILLVSQDPDQHRSATEQLLAKGYRVRTASDPFEAGVLSLGFLPDAILFDIGAPGLDVPAAIARLREIEATHQVATIAFGAHPTSDVIPQAYGAGLDDHLVGPLDAEAAAQHITDLCGPISDNDGGVPEDSSFELPIGAV
mgnify:CR=1 FL=1